MYNIIFCLPIYFNNPIKANFSNYEYPITMQTRLTQNVNSIFLIEKKYCFFTGFLKIIVEQNQLHITYSTALSQINIIKVIKVIKVRNPTPNKQVSNL